MGEEVRDFIVWDERSHRFLEINEFAIRKEGKLILLKDGRITDVVATFGGRYKLFNYIGKTDTEGNKIYADSSIVEFGYNGKNNKAIVTWDDIQLSYDFEFSNGFRCSYVNLYQEISNLKIIGTLQENPELLEAD
jgi:hypothetical protein